VTWRDLITKDLQKFWKDLKKVGKTFFSKVDAKKSKIADKTSSRIEVFREGWSKKSFGLTITFKI
jgi:hypothetical protein